MFSIIIPIYNVQDYLQDCLESILKQSQQIDIEVFLVDDGSTDNSGKIAKHFANLYPHIFKYLIKENGGLSDARNFAIPHAHKEYTIFIDSDDYISDDALTVLKDIVENQSVDLIIFDYINKWENKSEIVSLANLSKGYISCKDYLMMNPAAWNKVIKTKILKENHILFPKGLWYEDRATTANYINYCHNIYYCNMPLYYYRQRDNSIMKQKKFNPKMMDIITSMKSFDSQVSDHEFHDEKEYLFISNLLFQNALRMIPLKRYREMHVCYKVLKTKYPSWKKNIYFRQQSFGYRTLCYMISYRFYTLSRFFINFKLRGSK